MCEKQSRCYIPVITMTPSAACTPATSLPAVHLKIKKTILETECFQYDYETSIGNE